MQENLITIKKTNQVTFYILCPGLTGDEISVDYSQEKGLLSIAGEAKESTLSKNVDLNILVNISVEERYRSKEVASKLKNGALRLTLGLSNKVQVIEVNND